MACACGGSKGAQALASLARQAVPAAPGEQWEVVFPGGGTQTFDAQWQADRAIALLGGRKRRITTGPAPG